MRRQVIIPITFNVDYDVYEGWLANKYHATNLWIITDDIVGTHDADFQILSGMTAETPGWLPTTTFEKPLGGVRIAVGQWTIRLATADVLVTAVAPPARDKIKIFTTVWRRKSILTNKTKDKTLFSSAKPRGSVLSSSPIESVSYAASILLLNDVPSSSNESRVHFCLHSWTHSNDALLQKIRRSTTTSLLFGDCDPS